jgi:hypothetical protein
VPFLGGAALLRLFAGQRRTAQERSTAARPAEEEDFPTASRRAWRATAILTNGCLAKARNADWPDAALAVVNTIRF